MGFNILENKPKMPMYGITTNEKIPVEYLCSYTAWDQYMAHVWYNMIHFCGINDNSNVIEIAPGNSTKIGLALSKLSFSGNLYIVDPCQQALLIIEKKYKKILPKANIIYIQNTLKKSIKHLPKKPTLIAANHPLDDMLLVEGLSNKSLTQMYDDAFKSNDTPFDLLKSYWNRIEGDPIKLFNKKQRVFKQWESAVDNLEPSFVILGQYASSTLNQNNMSEVNNQAKDLLIMIKKRYRQQLTSEKIVQTILNANKNFKNLHVGQEVLNAKNWMLYKNPQIC